MHKIVNNGGLAPFVSGDPKDPTGYNAASRLKRQSYANDVMDNYNRSINFFHCFAKGVAFIGTFDN